MTMKLTLFRKSRLLCRCIDLVAISWLTWLGAWSTWWNRYFIMLNPTGWQPAQTSPVSGSTIKLSGMVPIEWESTWTRSVGPSIRYELTRFAFTSARYKYLVAHTQVRPLQNYLTRSIQFNSPNWSWNHKNNGTPNLNDQVYFENQIELLNNIKKNRNKKKKIFNLKIEIRKK